MAIPVKHPTTTHAAARGSDPVTSHLAAATIQKSRLEMAVYNYLLPHRGRYMTSIEIAKGMGIDKWSVSPRLKPLWVKGLLRDPMKMSALNSSGKIRTLLGWSVK